MSVDALKSLLRDNPIVVTGAGCVSAAGYSVEELWDAAVRGRGLAAWREFENRGVPARFAVCSVPPANADHTRRELHSLAKKDRTVQLAWLAARDAVNDARLIEAHPPERIGIMVGSSRGPISKSVEALGDPGPRGYPPSLVAEGTFASLSGALAQRLGVKGPGATISATCASAAFAIGLAAEQILLGKADAMIAGGVEAALQPSLLAQLKAAGVLGFHEEAGRTARPFCATRNGLVLGEGSAFLILESAAAAAARGARVKAGLAGWAMSLDDSGRTGVNEDGAGLQRVMRQAMDLAGLDATQVDYINAHGTATKCNDEAEANAVWRLLGERAATVPCTSTKPVTGHCLGATPALEAVLSIEALRRQVVPPTANCDHPDPSCRINALPLVSCSARIEHAMSNSLGFWGYQASLIFRRNGNYGV